MCSYSRNRRRISRWGCEQKNQGSEIDAAYLSSGYSTWRQVASQHLPYLLEASRGRPPSAWAKSAALLLLPSRSTRFRSTYRWAGESTLTPLGTQIQCNPKQAGERKIAQECGICKPVQNPATHDRSLVMSRGKRFESARRLLVFPANPLKTKNHRQDHRGSWQQ